MTNQEYRDELEKIKRKLNEKIAALKAANICSWRYDITNKIFFCSDEFSSLFGYEKEIETYEDFLNIIHEDDKKRVKKKIKKSIEKQKPFTITYRVRCSNGTSKIIYEKASFEITKKSIILNSVMQDITEIRELEHNLINIDKTLRQFLNIVNEQIITTTTDKKGYIVSISGAFSDITGYSEKELLGKKHTILKHPDMPEQLFKSLWETISDGRSWRGEIENLSKSGEVFWVDTLISPLYNMNNQIIGYTSIQNDITDKKKLEEISITDSLTSLYNRRYFSKIIQRELRREKRDGDYLTFIMLDVDHFKEYNDTYGHAAGDSVLVEIGKSLAGNMNRGGDYAFRLGGEEFGVIFSELNEKKSYKFAEKIRKDIENLQILHSTSSVSKYVTVSMGMMVADMKTDNFDEHTIYAMADEALYLAKRNGKNQVMLHAKDKLELF